MRKVINHTTEHVIEQLTDYNAKRRRIKVLRYELEHPAEASLNDVIGAMSFAKGDGEGRPAGHMSNKTMFIALNYQQETARLNSDAHDEIMVELLKLEGEVERLDFYLGLLEDKHRGAVVRFYCDGLTLQQTAESINTSPWNVRRLRDEAVEELAEMYDATRRGG